MKRRNEKRQPVIWFFSEMYYPEQTSTGHLLTEIAEAVAEEFPVKVITGPATQFLSAVSADPRETRNNVEIFRCSGTNFSKDHIIGRIANMLSRSVTIGCKSIFKCRRKDVAFVVTNPPLLPFFVRILAFVKGLKFVLLIHDVYPEALVASGICSDRSAVVKLGDIGNRWLYRRSTALVSLGRDMTELASQKLKDQARKIYTISNWKDDDLSPADKDGNIIVKELGLENRFIVLYAGNLGRTHGVEYIVDLAEQFKRFRYCHFIFLGFGAKFNWIESQITEMRLPNISLLGPRPRSEQQLFLNACDLAVISFIPGMAGISVPSRMYNQLAVGKPILAICDSESELAQVVIENQIGWVVSPGDREGLVKAMLEAIRDVDLCKAMGARAAIVANEKYSYSISMSKYRQMFRQIIGR